MNDLKELSLEEMVEIEGGVAPIIAYYVISNCITYAALGFTAGYLINSK